jgi:hypothetical protein
MVRSPDAIRLEVRNSQLQIHCVFTAVVPINVNPVVGGPNAHTRGWGCLLRKDPRYPSLGTTNTRAANPFLHGIPPPVAVPMDFHEAVLPGAALTCAPVALLAIVEVDPNAGRPVSLHLEITRLDRTRGHADRKACSI